MIMRRDGFLRVPIRADHQGRIQNISIGETALNGDPDPTLPYPQSLEISFDVVGGNTEVQVAPPWEGFIYFIPDSTLNHPTVPSDVSVGNFPMWPVTGDLLIRSMNSFAGSGGLDDAFATHLPLVDPLPSIVRFSKIRLTQDFLFTTVRDLPKYRFTFGGTQVLSDDPLRHQKLIVVFLAGKTGLPCRMDANDPTKDAALLPMPSVDLAPAGNRTTLRISVASASEESLSSSWFTMVPDYDAISGESFVPAAIDNFAQQLINPAHPNHSVFPARIIFQSAPAGAYAPDHAPLTPLRAALAAALPGGRSYRKLQLLRPPIPGPTVTSAAYRPYPMYRLCWRPTGGGATESLRMPLSGRMYLPLANDTFTFWVIPRSNDPALVVAGDQVKLSTLAPPPAHYIGVPQTTLDLAFAPATDQLTSYVHLQRYDSSMAWDVYKRIAAVRARHIAAAATAWNVPNVPCDLAHPHGVCNFYILPVTAARRPFSEVYGFIRESAGRHGLAPEFLHVVFFGEGGNQAIDAAAAAGGFDPAESLDTFNFVGLDLIVYRTGRPLPLGTPPVPPEATADGDADEIAEYTYNLVTEGYVDAATASAVTRDREVVRHEARTRTLQVGHIAGWQAVIELVAAELHSRLAEMVAHLGAPAGLTENERRFLSYVRFNSAPATARDHADHLATRMVPWVNPLPPGNQNALYNTIQRLAITQWHEAAGAYRTLEVS